MKPGLIDLLLFAHQRQSQDLSLRQDSLACFLDYRRARICFRSSAFSPPTHQNKKLKREVQHEFQK